ncbi:DUF6894 family protein [Allosphingosinicella deserti]|uniref:DUF6894 domain-containing protein n=1 Tax=Allosphingosinicella deserti TaxID=2116704 RepID=A0A2P7QUQ0_9SPHN|nr:hypothetical protein [Sphingomonas deserti]PSJ41682.1 hypothetical protein C7I55_05120 [Sphingomonas deserti]
MRWRVSRFFFHLRGGGLSLKDEIGTECRDVEEARSFALQVVEDLRRDETARLAYPVCARVDVEDEEAQPIFIVPVRPTISER